MNSRRPSKPNLSNVPKPSKLLALMRLRRTFVFSNLPDSAMAHSINQYQLVPSYLLLKYQTASSHIWVWWEKVLVKCTSQGCINGEVESRGIWRIKGWRLWMSQSCFSLGFLSQNSLWKLSTFYGYKRYLYSSENGMRRVSFFKTEWTGDLASRLDWVASSNRELTEWPVWTFCPVVL